MVKISKMITDIIPEMEIRAKALCLCCGMEAGDLRGFSIPFDPAVLYVK